MNYRVFDPTGNITVLAIGERDKKVADELIKSVPGAEQVGFITDGGKTLTMAGGEFCGNASMCAAALYCENTGEREVMLSVSGAEQEVHVEVSGQDGEYRCTVEMPPVISVDDITLSYAGKDYPVTAVRMQGICHLIINCKMDKKDAECAAVEWCEELSCDAVGLMFFNESTMEMKPLVYVKTAGTIFWESSCASGTTALGAYLAREKSHISEDINEPAGILHVEVLSGKIYLSGNVKAI